VDYNNGAWRGIAAPPGLPAEIARSMDAALDRVFKSKDYQDFLLARGFGAVYANADGFAQHLAAADVSLGNSMKEAGLAKV
jgi:tripartite-type tricarboxylate transporter receptor subunit TctC